MPTFVIADKCDGCKGPGAHSVYVHLPSRSYVLGQRQNEGAEPRAGAMLGVLLLCENMPPAGD